MRLLFVYTRNVHHNKWHKVDFWHCDLNETVHKDSAIVGPSFEFLSPCSPSYFAPKRVGLLLFEKYILSLDVCHRVQELFVSRQLKSRQESAL